MNDADFEVWLAGQAADAERERERVVRDAEDAERALAIEAMGAVTTSAPRPPSPKRKRKRHTPTYKPVVLLPGQAEHMERLRGILLRFPFALDLSMLGAGKTYTSAYLAQHGIDGTPFKHIVVICPVSVLHKWKFMEQEFGLPITHAIGYQELRSRTCHQPKHGLLHRRDFTVVNEVFATSPKVEFTCSDEYRAMVDAGTLLIVDEVQNIKNVSSQFLAAQTMIKEITRRVGSGLVTPTLFQQVAGITPCASRVLVLSGSPIDQKEHATHLFRALGVMTAERVAQYNIHTRVNDWRGMREIHTFCFRIDAAATLAIPPQYRESRLDPYIYRLFQGVFKRACSSAMTTSSTAVTLTKQNAFYNVDEASAVILQRGLYNLSSAARFNGTTVSFGPSDAGGMQLAGVSRAMQIIETGKISMLIRIVKAALETPQAKVVVAVNYVDTVSDLKAGLAEYAPLLLVGSTTHSRRKIVLELFQEASVRHRLLICNQSVASTGIDLDDKHGDFPRTCFVSPNYSTITSYQLGHRFLRLDTRSHSSVHFVYAKREGKSADECSDIIELPVLNALSKKSVIMKETTTEQVAAGIVFPGDHPEWEE